MGCVAAAEVEHIIMQQGVDDIERFADAAAPFLGTMRSPRFIADIVVIGLALVDRMMCQLKMRGEMAVREDGAAYAGAEREHYFEPAPRDDAEPLHFRIIEQTRRLAEAARDCHLEWIVFPRLCGEMRRRDDMAATDHARKADGNPVERRQPRDQACDRS